MAQKYFKDIIKYEKWFVLFTCHMWKPINDKTLEIVNMQVISHAVGTMINNLC